MQQNFGLLAARQFLITRCAGQDSICRDNYIILHIPSCVQRVARVCLRWWGVLMTDRVCGSDSDSIPCIVPDDRLVPLFLILPSGTIVAPVLLLIHHVDSFVMTTHWLCARHLLDPFARLDLWCPAVPHKGSYHRLYPLRDPGYSETLVLKCDVKLHVPLHASEFVSRISRECRNFGNDNCAGSHLRHDRKMSPESDKNYNIRRRCV